MKRNELVVGKVYLVRHSSGVIKALLESITEHSSPFNCRTRTSYNCTNLNTGRFVYFRSAIKFIKEAEK